MPEIKIRRNYVPNFPPTILVDSNEQYPWVFNCIPTDKAEGDASWLIKVERAKLYIPPFGRELDKSADYSLRGFQHRIMVERKSKEDLFSTLGQRRDQFEQEIQLLNDIPIAAVVLECDWSQIADGCRNSLLKPKTVNRTIHAWTQRYRNVHWWPCFSRQHAEITTFHIFRRFWIDLAETDKDYIAWKQQNDSYMGRCNKRDSRPT